MRYVSVMLLLFSMIVLQVQGKEYHLFVANGTDRALDLELFGIKHTMPGGTQRRFISEQCWGEIKGSGGMAALFAINNFVSHAFALIKGKKKSLIDKDQTCKEKQYAVIQQVIYTGKDALDIMNKKQWYTGTFENYKVKNGQIKFHNPVRVFIGNREITPR